MNGLLRHTSNIYKGLQSQAFPTADGAGQVFTYDEQYAYITDNGELDINQATTDFCFGGFVKITSDTGFVQYLFGKQVYAGTMSGRYSTYVGTDGKIGFFSRQTDGNTTNIISGTTVTLNTEYFLLVRIDLINSKIYLYIDGILQNTGGTSYVGTFSTMNNKYKYGFGGANDVDGTTFRNGFNGYVRDSRIYHKDVSSSENQTKWISNKKIGDEVAWWDFPTLTGFDNTGYNLIGVNLYVPVILELGQSNAGGRALSDRLACSTYSPTPDLSYIYAKTDYSATDNGVWAATEAGVNTTDSDLIGVQPYFGAEISLQQKMADRLKTNSYYIKCADGSTSLNLAWNVNQVGLFYDISRLYFFTPAITKLALLYPDRPIKIIAILWHQGETDAYTQSSIDDYLVNLTAFISGIRSYNSLLNNVPFIITKIHFEESAGEAQINSIFDTAESTLSKVYTIDISDLPKKDELTTEEKCSVVPPVGDDNHQSYLAQLGKGERIYNKLVELELI